MSEELKPCPFCDYRADKYVPEIERVKILHSDDRLTIYLYGNCKGDSNYVVVCGNCGAQSSMFQYEQDAISSWNTRPAGGEEG